MDGDYDLILGTANGNVYFAENTGTASNPVFSGYIMLTCQGSPIDAGTYSRETVTDWNEDGVPDLIVGGLTGSSPTFYRRLQVYLGTSVSNQDEENGTISDQCSFAVSGSPTKNILALNFQLSQPNNARVTIIDCFGRVAGSYNWLQPAGNSLMSADISANQPGLYFVVAEIADHRLTDRVMLIR